MMKNKIFKTMLVMLLILSVLAVFTACSKDGAGEVKGQGTTAANTTDGENQSPSLKLVGFDSHFAIVSLDGRTVYKYQELDYENETEKSMLILLDEKTNKEETIVTFDEYMGDFWMSPMYFTGEKLYYSLQFYQENEELILYSYDIATKATEKIKIPNYMYEDYGVYVLYIDDTYIYFSGYTEENVNKTGVIGPDTLSSVIKYNLQTGEFAKAIPDGSALVRYETFVDGYCDNIVNNHLLYYDNDFKALYVYDFEEEKSYKISDNAIYTHYVGDRVYYRNIASSCVEIYSCTWKGTDNKLVQKFDAVEETGYRLSHGCGDYVYVDEYEYECNLKDGTYRNTEDDDILYIADGEDLYCMIYFENSEGEYVRRLYNINNGLENKKHISDEFSDEFWDSANIKDGKFYCFEPDYETMKLELKIIPLK